MAKLPFAPRGPGPPLWQEALRNWEIPKNGNMIWRNYLNKGNLPLDLGGAFLPTTSEDEFSLHGSSLAFVGCTQAALNWFFSSRRANICWWLQAWWKPLLGGRQAAPIALTLPTPGQGRRCAAQTPSSYRSTGRGASRVPQRAARAPAGAESVCCTGRAVRMQPENKQIMGK